MSSPTPFLGEISSTLRVTRVPSPRDTRIPFCALMVFTFILVVVPQGLFPALQPLRLAFASAVFATVSYVIARLGQGKPLTVWAPGVRLVLVLLALAFLSVPTSYWPGGSVNTIADLLGKSVVVFLLLANLLGTTSRLRSMLWLLALCSTAPALAVIKNYLDGTLMEREARVQGYLGGLTSNPNDVALTLNIILPLAVGLLATTRRPSLRILLGSVIALGVAGIIVTLSRAGFIFLIATTVLYLKAVRRQRVWAVLLVSLILALSLGVPGFIDRMMTSADLDTPGSAQQRWEDMKKSVGLMIVHPLFGVGIGQNILALNELGTFWNLVHNVYLQVGSELGVAGLIVYLLLLRHSIRSAAEAERAWRQRRAPEALHHVARGLKISLIGFAVAANFHPVAYHFYFYYLAGLAVAAKVLARQANGRAGVLGRVARREWWTG